MLNTVFALWPDKPYSPAERAKLLLTKIQQTILAKKPQWLSMCIADEAASRVKSPAPKWYKGDALVAVITVNFGGDQSHNASIKQALEQAGFVVGVYQTDTSIYKNYGDNPHFRKRDWLDGTPSPTVMAVTLLTRPKKHSQEEWIRRWHGRMSPDSERLQPRARYVRHMVLDKDANTPAFDGIVEEAWPSAKHIHNPYLFYCANNRWQLIKHMLQMLRAITHFHNLFKIRTVTMTEYFLKTNFNKNEVGND